ncbi:MAG: SRPBCC family protein [Chloroflexota bacterium]|nr:MAG: SRPBCC family protein [Chloroflexota bacterium]
MSKIETSVIIDRPVEEVFAYIVDPKNTPEWAGPVIEARQTSEGAVGLGTTSSRITQFLGRTMEATYEITEFEPYEYYADRTTSGPVPINARMSLNPVIGGTELTIEGEIESAGFFKLAEPVLARMAKRQVATDAQTLKEILEAR